MPFLVSKCGLFKAVRQSKLVVSACVTWFNTENRALYSHSVYKCSLLFLTINIHYFPIQHSQTDQPKEGMVFCMRYDVTHGILYAFISVFKGVMYHR